MTGRESYKKARKYHKGRNWDKAIEYYSKAVESEEKKAYGYKLYFYYAHVLRIAGRYDDAKKILFEGCELYTNETKLLEELFRLYDTLAKWDKAEKIAKELINLEGGNPEHYFRLGRVYTFKREKEKAKESYEQGLSVNHGVSFKQLIDKVRSNFPIDKQEIKTEYKYIKGKNNLGNMVHSFDGGKYITKILRNRAGSKKEVSFYKEITSHFSELADISPSFIDFQIIDNIIYLTIEMVDGLAQNEQKKYLNEIIDASFKITSVKKEKISKHYKNSNYSLQLKRRAISIVPFFTRINEREVNERLFRSLKSLGKQNKYPEQMIKVIEELEDLILENRLYKWIDEKRHYSLIHGDFIPGNMLVDKKSKNIKVIDWATYKVGLSVSDMSMYFVGSSTKYEKIKEVYLSRKELELIEKIFFLYILITMHYVQLRYGTTDKLVNEMLAPALRDLKLLINEFKQTSFNVTIDMFERRNRLLVEKVKHLETENNQLRKEIERLEKRHRNMLSSKSWRITSPLRKIVKIKKIILKK